MKMKSYYLILLIFNVLASFGQNNNLVQIKILESVVTKKLKEDVVKITVKIVMDSCCLDSIYFYRFPFCVPSNPFVSDTSDLKLLMKSSIGLNYFIEDSKGNIISGHEEIRPIYKYMKDEIRSSYKIIKLNKKRLTITHEDAENLEDFHRNQIAKIIVGQQNCGISLYPLINVFHNIPKGEYFLFLVYSFHDEIALKPPTSAIWDANKPPNNMIYNGIMVSNKIKLIIE